MNRAFKIRKRWPRGTWMKLISSDTLRALMDQKGFTGARLGRAAGVSRAFISQLRLGTKRSCSKDVAEFIAEALDVPLTLLFYPQTPSTDSRNMKRQAVAA